MNLGSPVTKRSLHEPKQIEVLADAELCYVVLVVLKHALALWNLQRWLIGLEQQFP